MHPAKPKPKGDGRSDEEKNSIFSLEFHTSNEKRQEQKSEESKSFKEPAAPDEAPSTPPDQKKDSGSPFAAIAALQNVQKGFKKPGTVTLNPFGSKHTSTLAAAAKMIKNLKLKPG